MNLAKNPFIKERKKVLGNEDNILARWSGYLVVNW